MTVLRLAKMKDSEIKKLVKEQFLCRIAFKGDDYPHIAPFQYVFLGGNLYFHFTSYGRKMQLLDKDKQVCVEIEKYDPDFGKYMFATLKGELEVVTNPTERARAIEMMRQFGEKNLSPKFLEAHGLRTTDGWAAFTEDKDILIVRLHQLVEETGLKCRAN